MVTAVKKRRPPARKKTQTSALAKLEPLSKEVWFRDIQGLLLFIAALALLVSFLSSHQSFMRLVGDFSGDSQARLTGPVGRLVGTILVGFLGWSALVPVLWLGWCGYSRWRVPHTSVEGRSLSAPTRVRILLGWIRVLGFFGISIASATIFALWSGKAGGGIIGAWLASPLEQLFHRVGGTIIGVGAFVIFLSFTLQQSLRGTLSAIGHGILRFAQFMLVSVPLFMVGFIAGLVNIVYRGVSYVVSSLLSAGWEARDEQHSVLPPTPKLHTDSVKYEEEDLEVKDVAGNGWLRNRREDSPRVVVQRRGKLRKSEVTALRKQRRGALNGASTKEEAPYELPDLGLLLPGEPSQERESDEELLEKSRLIEGKLKDFGIAGRVTQVHPGPVITLFEFEPAPGVKVGKIAALQDDLAMSLRANSIRIIAPIPKRGTVGIEVPNRNRDLVRLRDVLESAEFIGASSSLTVAVGKDTYGESVVVDIASLPHLLMAGATGTGKSVCINAMLLSLLYRANPSELGLILIDPKILELSVYEGIPHLRVPVVTSARQAKAVLEWAVNEMNRRYRLMQRFGVRSIDGYNRIVTGETPNTSMPGFAPSSKVIALNEESIIQEGTAEPKDSTPPVQGMEGAPLVKESLSLLPKIVIVIDELADLMFSVGREVEDLITRLAQKARASGIHLIVATQRPSVDVITGLIKANFPARLSFRVTSRVDSRTILDSIGAEKLLGKGDMLFMLPGAVHVRRVHGAFVSDAEVQKVIAELKNKHQPLYDQNIVDICEKALKDDEADEAGENGEGGDDYDEFYDKAVEYVMQKGHASTSLIQRAFRIGYNRAARIVEMMERDGIVGPMDGAKPRQVLHQRGEEE